MADFDGSWALADTAITALREALAEQAKQKPVAWVEVERGIPMFMNFTEDYKPYINNGIAPLYAAPVRTKDLTDGEVLEITKRFALGIAFPVGGATTPEMFARAVIAADREKNK